MSEETKAYRVFFLVGGGVLLLEGILICLLSAAGVLVYNDPSLQTPLRGIILGIFVFCMGVLILFLTLAQIKGWLKETFDERKVKMTYKATFHAFYISMFVAFNLILLDHFTNFDWVLTTATTGISYVIFSGALAFLFSMIIQEVR